MPRTSSGVMRSAGRQHRPDLGLERVEGRRRHDLDPSSRRRSCIGTCPGCASDHVLTARRHSTNVRHVECVSMNASWITLNPGLAHDRRDRARGMPSVSSGEGSRVLARPGDRHTRRARSGARRDRTARGAGGGRSRGCGRGAAPSLAQRGEHLRVRRAVVAVVRPEHLDLVQSQRRVEPVARLRGRRLGGGSTGSARGCCRLEHARRDRRDDDGESEGRRPRAAHGAKGSEYDLRTSRGYAPAHGEGARRCRPLCRSRSLLRARARRVRRRRVRPLHRARRAGRRTRSSRRHAWAPRTVRSKRSPSSSAA